MRALAQKVIDCCRELALFTEEPGHTTRTFLSPPMRDVHERLRAWMEELGMRVWVDAAGNLRGVHGTGGKRLMIGSHLDTVPNAGAFDGILGVVMGIAVAEASRAEIEVVGFSEEEGVRFGFPFIGSRALVGTLDASAEVKDAIREFGIDPAGLRELRMPAEVEAYLEFHIEQGPVLESLDLPLGVVEAIAGQSRYMVTFAGEANHAGTTPMHLRKDAAVAAAQWICEVERCALRHDGLVATTGSVSVSPNAGNVIAGEARVSLDVRHANDDVRENAVRTLIAEAERLAGARGIEVAVETRMQQSAVPMDAALVARVERAVEEAGYPVHRMVSGAGHDAMIVAPYVPSAMLFLRSPGGISHHPDEDVSVDDVAAALEAGVRFAKYV